MKREDYDLAMFRIEQACQLIVKAKLLDLTDILRKHSLRELLSDLLSVFKEEEIEKFVKDNWSTLRNLEFAYIASKYLEECKKDEVVEALKVYKKLWECYGDPEKCLRKKKEIIRACGRITKKNKGNCEERDSRHGDLPIRLSRGR